MRLWIWLPLLLIVSISGTWLLTQPADSNIGKQTASLLSGGTSLAVNPAGSPLSAEQQNPNELKVYRWKDENNQWALANTPPPEGTAHQVIDYTPQ